jgi:hypothetical protein
MPEINPNYPDFYRQEDISAISHMAIAIFNLRGMAPGQSPLALKG